MSLDFREKNAIAKQLAGDIHLEKDKKLLGRYLPQDRLLFRTASASRPDLSFDIIFLLLDFTSKENILANRESIVSGPTVIDLTKPTESNRSSKPAVKKKSQKKKSIPKLNGPGLKKLKSEMLTRSTQIGSIVTGACAILIKSLK